MNGWDKFCAWNKKVFEDPNLQLNIMHADDGRGNKMSKVSVLGATFQSFQLDDDMMEKMMNKKRLSKDSIKQLGNNMELLE